MLPLLNLTLVCVSLSADWTIFVHVLQLSELTVLQPCAVSLVSIHPQTATSAVVPVKQISFNSQILIFYDFPNWWNHFNSMLAFRSEGSFLSAYYLWRSTDLFCLPVCTKVAVFLIRHAEFCKISFTWSEWREADY